MIKKCLECGEIKKIKAKGLCNRCYTKQLELPIIICSSCGERKKQYAKGLCSKCYYQKRVSKIIKCKKCGLKKPYFALGMCNNCYNKQRKQPVIKCKICGESKIHKAKGLCRTCYNNQWNQKHGIIKKPLRKSCPQYLGVHVAEKVLSKAFKNVKRMPYHNPGYDFICNKGMKVDVKSGVLRKDKKRPKSQGHWLFKIRKNKVADYFLCLAFDNREDLNPIHVWLIPGEITNKKRTLIMGSRTIPLYYKYEKRIDNIIKCCDKMKS